MMIWIFFQLCSSTHNTREMFSTKHEYEKLKTTDEDGGDEKGSSSDEVKLQQRNAAVPKRASILQPVYESENEEPTFTSFSWEPPLRSKKLPVK